LHFLRHSDKGKIVKHFNIVGKEHDGRYQTYLAKDKYISIQIPTIKLVLNKKYIIRIGKPMEKL